MNNYLALIVAVENYHDKKHLPEVSYALNDAVAFRDTLIKLGCKNDNIEYLTDHLATKTSISEKLKNLSQYATPTDTIIIYYAGHGFYHSGKNLISCVDTLLSSLTSTTISLDAILSPLEKSKSKKIIVFLDCCHSGIEFSETERSPVTDFNIDDLKYEYKDSEHLIVFASCKSEEKSQADSEREHGVWSYYLIQALNGKADNIYDGPLLFSHKLQKYLAEKTSHRVKMITTDKKNQTPIKYGKESLDKFIVADLTKIFELKKIKTKTETIKFERATILSIENDWVKLLPGFKPNHKLPKEIDDYHDNWIKSISKELIEDELNEMANIFRQKLGYKRKDILDPKVESGFGQLVTLDFDYSIYITQSETRADKYTITRSIENFKNGDILKDSTFNEIFNDTFDRLELRMNKKLDVSSVIDKIEEIDDEELINVEYERTDTSTCQVFIKDLTGHIVISEHSFTLKMDRKSSPQSMVLHCQRVYKEIESIGIQKLLN